MTSGDKQLKNQARALAREQGISYTSARRQILSAPASASRDPRVFTVAHTKAGMGVSTLAAGLAQAWADQGYRVLLVDTTDSDSPSSSADMVSSGDATIHVEAIPVLLPNGMRVDDRPLHDRLNRAREDFDVVVVEWGDYHHRWDLPGDQIVVPVMNLSAEMLGLPPAHHRMWIWLTEEYCRFAATHPETIAYEALLQANEAWLDSLSEEEFDRWEEANAPDEGPQRVAFLKDVAERAHLMWGHTWTDHAEQWEEWDDRGDDQCEASALLPRSAQDVADVLLSSQHMMSLDDISAWARIVCVANRQEELPAHLNALLGEIRAELGQRGLRLANTAISESGMMRRWSATVDADTEPKLFPAQALEHFRALATELIRY